MAGVGETAVVQSNGAVGVPVIAAAASAATSKGVASESTNTSQSSSPVSSNPAISTAQAHALVQPTIQNQVLAPGVTTSATEAAIVTTASNPSIVPGTTTGVPPAEVSSSSPPVVPPSAEASTSSLDTHPSYSPPVAPVAVGETTALSVPASEATTAVASETAVALTSTPGIVQSGTLSTLISSTSLPAASTSEPPVQTGSQASAIGDTNIFAPAISDVSVSSSIDSATVIPSSSSSQQSVEESTVAGDTSAISSQVVSAHPSSYVTHGAGTISTTQSTHTNSAAKSSIKDGPAESTTEATHASDSPGSGTTDPGKPTSTGKDAIPDTTFISGTVTYTGAAAVSAAEFAKTGDHQTAKNGMSSFAIIGIVGGILVFCILLYIGWFQWRKRRSRDDESDDGDYMANDAEFDPYGLAKEKHSGFDFIDQPLSSRRSDRYKSTATGVTANPFADPQTKRGRDRDRDTEYVETWYSDPGEAGLGTAKSQQIWYDDRRPSYIDGPQSIYHETNDPSDPFNQRSEDDRPRSTTTTANAPPVPPLPAAYRKSEAPSRPRTDFSYGDFYGGYDSARSRPGTQYTQYTHDQVPQTPSEGQATPSTAAMLPWLHPAESPPLPSPVDPRAVPTRQITNGFGSPPKMPLRGPVAAAMAQTPQMQDRGFQGVIPTFR